MSQSKYFGVTSRILFVYLLIAWFAWMSNILAWISRFSVSATSAPLLWPHNHLVAPLWLFGFLIGLGLLQFNDVILEAFGIPREIRKGGFYVSVFIFMLVAVLFGVKSLLVLIENDWMVLPV